MNALERSIHNMDISVRSLNAFDLNVFVKTSSDDNVYIGYYVNMSNMISDIADVINKGLINKEVTINGVKVWERKTGFVEVC